MLKVETGRTKIGWTRKLIKLEFRGSLDRLEARSRGACWARAENESFWITVTPYFCKHHDENAWRNMDIYHHAGVVGLEVIPKEIRENVDKEFDKLANIIRKEAYGYTAEQLIKGKRFSNLIEEEIKAFYRDHKGIIWPDWAPDTVTFE